MALIVGSKPALWLALLTSGKFGFERDTIEKSTIDQILVPDYDAIDEAERARADELFTRLVKANDTAGWAEVDAWVSHLYGLHREDIRLVDDTLRFNLPFALNRRAAQKRPTDQEVRTFGDVLQSELRPWGERKGQIIRVSFVPARSASPWRALQVHVTPVGQALEQRQDGNLAALVHAADRLAATQLIYRDPAAECLWVERLDQARYWSEAQARSLARQVMWEHVDLLTGRRN